RRRDDLADGAPAEPAATRMSDQTAGPVAAASPAATAKALQHPVGFQSSASSAQARPARVPQDELLGKLSGDAPFCDTCGHITVRNGTCYKCLNCGNSMGCS